ncbi:hypothetical protein SAMN05216464_1249 [Mucilaginibacter pineti]|uniref:Uncharacterized protein n=1 Tax=Mucilaginibacter pineti TaxID=1391627 RepID=A0A1G7N025_9SPHI|nr:hypothetical protein [Mucilaginibacter pineti]SDF67398.1 hypothetical protein SAMN05216464_1249 [Mucilaginibacter pineti]
MKKISLLIILAACIGQLKAQIVVVPKLGNKTPEKSYQLKPDSSLSKFIPGIQDNVINGLFDNSISKETIYSKMPVIGVSSLDRMPIAKLGEHGMHYTMLIKKYDIINPNNTKSQKTDPVPVKITP